MQNVKNGFRTQNLFLSPITQTNVHIPSDYSKHISLSESGVCVSSTACPLSSGLLESLCLLILSWHWDDMSRTRPMCCVTHGGLLPSCRPVPGPKLRCVAPSGSLSQTSCYVGSQSLYPAHDTCFLSSPQSPTNTNPCVRQFYWELGENAQRLQHIAVKEVHPE